MTSQELAVKVGEWMDAVLIPNTKNPTNRFKLGFIRPFLPQQIEEMCYRLADLGIDVMSPDTGDIDIARLRESIRSGMNASGGITISGMTFSSADAESLFSHIDGMQRSML